MAACRWHRSFESARGARRSRLASPASAQAQGTDQTIGKSGGYTYRINELFVGPQDENGNNVPCVNEQAVVGGGVELGGGPEASYIDTLSSQFNPGWTVRAWDGFGTESTSDIFAICKKIALGDFSGGSADHGTGPGPATETETAKCEAGKMLGGGGFFAGNDLGQVVPQLDLPEGQRLDLDRLALRPGRLERDRRERHLREGREDRRRDEDQEDRQGAREAQGHVQEGRRDLRRRLGLEGRGERSSREDDSDRRRRPRARCPTTAGPSSGRTTGSSSRSSRSTPFATEDGISRESRDLRCNRGHPLRRASPELWQSIWARRTATPTSRRRSR